MADPDGDDISREAPLEGVTDEELADGLRRSRRGEAISWLERYIASDGELGLDVVGLELFGELLDVFSNADGLTTIEAAALLGLRRGTFIDAVERYGIPHRMDGTRRLFRFSDVVQFRGTVLHVRPKAGDRARRIRALRQIAELGPENDVEGGARHDE